MISEKSKELGEKIKEVIIKKKLSQKEVALKAGVSEEQVSRLMHGKNEPLFVTIVKLAEALDIPMVALFDEDIETSSLIKGMMKNLPEDMAKKVSDADNTEWLILGLDMKDTDLSPEDIKLVVETYKVLKEKGLR